MRQKAPYITEAVPIGSVGGEVLRIDPTFVAVVNELIDRTGGPTRDAVQTAQTTADTAQTTADTALAQASGVQLQISKAAVAIFSYANGSTPSFADATGQATLFSGATDVTGGATFSVTATSCSGSINTSFGIPVPGQPKGFYRVTALSADTGTLTINATYQGTTQVRAFTVSRMRTGFEIVGTLPSADLFEGRVVFLTTNDRLYRYDGSAWTSAVPASDVTGQITTTQISDLAISTPKLAADAVTASKLLVVAPGAALNVDPSMADSSAWETYAGAVTFATVTDGKVGNTVARSTGGGVQGWQNERRRIPIDAAKTYRVRAWIRTVSGSGSTAWMGVALFDSSGANISGDGTQWFYAANNATVGSSWTEYVGTFGSGSSKTFPSNARTMSPLFILSYGGGTSVHEIQDLRIEEVMPGTLIKDGAITSDKVFAGAIVAGKIGTNAIVADNIQAGAITSNKLESDLVLASTIKTSASGYRTEISNSGDFPIWYGTGTKNTSNGLFYVKTDGSVFFKGTIGSGSAIQLFRITAASATGSASGAAASGTVTATGSVTLENGVAPYTYAWTLLTTDTGPTPTISSTTSSAPTFSATVTDDGTNNEARSVWQVVVTDNIANQAVRNAVVSLTWTDTR